MNNGPNDLQEKGFKTTRQAFIQKQEKRFLRGHPRREELFPALQEISLVVRNQGITLDLICEKLGLTQAEREEFILDKIDPNRAAVAQGEPA